MFELLEDLHPGHNFRWKKKGQTGLGFCPYHNDKRNRSLSVYKDSNGKIRFKCFACGAGSTESDAVILTQALHDKTITRVEANRWLIAHGYAQETEIETKERERSEAMFKFYRYTNDLLVKDERASGLRAYVASRNVRAGLIPILPIGYYPPVEDVEVWLQLNGIPDYLREEFIPSSEKAYDLAKGSIIFFYRSSYDYFHRMKLRNPFLEKPNEEKVILYLGKGGKNKLGFFMPTVEGSNAEHAIVVEGEFDVLALFSMCRDHDPECVEPIFCFGSGVNMRNGIDILTNAGVDNIYAFADNDNAGIRYAGDIADAHPHTFIVHPDDYAEGDDPASWAGQHTFDDLQNSFRQRKPAFEWIGKRLAEEYQNGSAEDQSHAKEKVIDYAKKLSPTNREIFLKSYAPLTGASFEALWEEIQDSNNVRYRKVLSGDNFGIQMLTMVPGKKGPQWEPICNVIIEHEKDLIYDDGSDETPTREFQMRLLMAHKEKVITVKSEDYTNDKRFEEALYNALGTDLWFKPKHIPFIKESAAILLKSGKAKKEETIYMHTGWRDGRFLMPNGYIDHEGFHELGDIRVELPSELQMFKGYHTAPPPSDLEFSKKLVRESILQVFPYEITLPAFAHFFLAPLKEFIPSRNSYCLWVTGRTGSFKTSYISLLNCFFGNFRDYPLMSWTSTANSIEKNGYYVKDLVYVVDDYKKADVLDKYVVHLIQAYADGTGRSRLRSDSGNQRTWNIRGLLTVTAEDVPSGEASVVARTLMLPVRTVGDSQRLTEAQMHFKHMPGIMAKYIQYLTERRLRPEDLMAKIRSYQSKYRAMHSRISENLATNALAWEMVADFLDLHDLDAHYFKGADYILKYMDGLTKSEQASTMYVDLVRELLSSGNFYLEGIKGEDSTEHHESARRMGWISTENVLLLGSVAFAEANNLRTRVYGSPIKYSTQALYDQLAADNLIELQGGKTSGVVKIDGASHRVLKFRRGVLEHRDEATDINSQFENRKIRIEEDGAVLNR